MADQAKLKKRIDAMLKWPDNQICADCKKRGPRWASANLGIFICIECSGIHRNLGVHISFVRSVNLDSWTKAQVDFMEEWGNGRANTLFEAAIPAHVYRPKEGDPVRVVEKFIRDKYEYKRYIASTIPPPPSVADSEPTADNTDQSARRRSQASAVGPHDSNPAAFPPAKPPKAAIQLAAPTPTAAPTPSLIDFSDPEPPAHSNAQPDFFNSFQQATPAVYQQQQASHSDLFSTFQNVAVAPMLSPQQEQVHLQAGFAQVQLASPTDQYLMQPQQAAAAAQVPQTRQQTSNDAILSLYSYPQQPQQQRSPPGPYNPAMGWNAPQMPLPPPPVPMQAPYAPPYAHSYAQPTDRMLMPQQPQLGGYAASLTPLTQLAPMGQPQPNFSDGYVGGGYPPSYVPLNPFQQQMQQQQQQQYHMHIQAPVNPFGPR